MRIPGLINEELLRTNCQLSSFLCNNVSGKVVVDVDVDDDDDDGDLLLLI